MLFDVFEKIFKKLKSTFLSRAFLIFCLLGVVNTFNTAVFSWALSFLLQKNMSAILGYILSLQGAYFLSCKFIFNCPPTLQKYERFLVSYIPSFIVYVMLHVGMIAMFNQFWGTFVAVALSGPVTYIIIKLYAFGASANKQPKKKRKNEEQD